MTQDSKDFGRLSRSQRRWRTRTNHDSQYGQTVRLISVFFLVISTVVLELLPVVEADNLHLTMDDYYELTTSKTVFLKFYAPWCSFCKKMANDWDQLSSHWEGHEVGLVAEVDCTDHKKGGQQLCKSLGIDSFPTLKYGDPHDLWEYTGGRSFAEMNEFAEENLVPVCSLENLQVCDADTKELLENLVQMDEIQLKQLIEAEEKKLEDAETAYRRTVDKLTQQYENAEAKRRKEIDDVLAGQLGMMRQVMLARKHDVEEDEDGEDVASNSPQDEL